MRRAKEAVIIKERRGRPARFDDRHHEVLQTAARIFSDLGYRYATLDNVAGALDMTRPALYYYAKSKEELLSKCFKVASDKLAQALAEAELGRTGLECLSRFFRSYLDFICDSFGKCFALTDRREMPSEEKERTRLLQLALARSIEAMIVKGMIDGSIRQCDPADVARLFFAAFNGVPRWYKIGQSRSSGQVADAFLDILIVGIAGHAGAPSHSAARGRRPSLKRT
jgi:TetR/AcrR family transcriptional regulator, cholesterol catabolism regulator